MTMTISQRNSLVQEYLWCIDRVMEQNAPLIKATHLDQDDVYQTLAMRLIRAVERYDSHNDAGKSLTAYILMNLGHALRACSSALARYGFRDAPDYLSDAVVSMEVLAETDLYWEMCITV